MALISFNSRNRIQKDLENTVVLINREYRDLKSITSKMSVARRDEYLKGETAVLKREIKNYMNLGYSESEALEKVLPRAYGLVKLASEIIYGKPHYDVQLMGGVALNRGLVSEMATGEGKTLTATLPVYLNALTGKGVHVVTPNNYLAKRDQEETSKIYELLGLSCGLVVGDNHFEDDEIEEEMIRLNNGDIASLSKKDYSELRLRAMTSLRTSRKMLKRMAYDQDITYTSASELAFDYLKDTIADDSKDMVQLRDPNFVLIDEVDNVLFDDARIPFTLSGTSKVKDEFRDDEYIKLERSQIEELEQYPEKINQAILSLAILSGRMYNVDPGNNGLRTINKTHTLSDIKGMAKKFSKLPYVISHPLPKNAELPDIVEYDAEKNFVSLTEEGNMLLYQYFNARDLFKFTSGHTDEIINFKDRYGRKKYVKDLDYVITGDGSARFTEFGLIKALSDNDFKELSDGYTKWANDLYTERGIFIQNALTAYFGLTNGEDYQVKETENNNGKGRDKRTISLIVNGRTAEGRVYSNGLQQALELKEKSIAQRFNLSYDVKVSKYKDTLASIPATAFFARYKTIAGMTGTSAQKHFEELYRISTVAIPRNKASHVIDRGEMLYFSRKEKEAAIVQEVIESYQKGQPVLISTTNVNESEALYRRIQKELAHLGIKAQINVLNANVSKLSEEAQIISRAGLPGAITISTDMAGRGTDIKLGGERKSFDELVAEIRDDRIKNTILNLERQGTITDDNRRRMEMMVKQFVTSKNDEIEKEAAKRQKQYETVKAQVEKAGGLKVIGSGHFPYTRDKDLEYIGVRRDVLNKLKRSSNGQVIIDNPARGINTVQKEVMLAQERFENMVADGIRYNEEKEGYICKFREDIASQKRALKKSGDYTDAIYYMIEETANDLVRNVAKYNISMVELADDIESCLGIKVTPSKLNEYSDLKQLASDVASIGIEKFTQIMKSKDRSSVEETNRKLVNIFIDRSWEEFSSLVEDYKFQENLNALAHYDADTPFEEKATKSFLNCVICNRACIVKEILNPKSKANVHDIFPISIDRVKEKQTAGEKKPKYIKRLKTRKALYRQKARLVLTPNERLGVINPSIIDGKRK